jgi:hypothetical protein
MSEDSVKEKNVFSGIKDRAVFLGWIAAVLLVGTLLWTLTASIRETFLLKSVNRIFISRNDARRLEAPIHIKKSSGKLSPLGTWYTQTNSKDTFFVFTIMWNGVLAVYGIPAPDGGEVGEIIPLSIHAEQMLKRIPPGVVQTYIRRIEEYGRKNG